MAAKLLMVFFVFNIVNPHLNFAQRREFLQAVQNRGDTFAQRYAGVQAAVGLP
ncbi:Uncharacterised protein [Kluyvera cryocrescens]|uniref:Uncharacterized protein n=1 Tax=Kluyvera cryocrescens TaxID=580 RepID=A0A485BQW9_KLUCR|nr:Uncharacterised protein [Kluyvera cryocrescens]